MLFNSFEFIIFFPVVTIGFFLLPHKARWAWLLMASCYFYMFFKPIYILILAGTIIIDYFAGLLIEKTEDKKRRKWYLALSLVANIGILAYFKYYNFLAISLSQFLSDLGLLRQSFPLLDFALPIGLSFHTFQAMSYTIEVYRGNQKAERHFGIYALYVMFYPQLVAGPIERPQNVLPQFHEVKTFDYQRFRLGLQLMAWGLFKKVVIADRLAVFVDSVYVSPLQHSGFEFVTGIIFFTFQIYCDFSGYSDIALGSAQVMGFRLMKNFDRPYFSKTISEFWHRWHISLSTWFRDYLYIPLGGNRVSKPRWYFNQFTVFLVSGIWHGANWNYIIWGALHGFYLIFALFTKNSRNSVINLLKINQLPVFYKVIQVITTFVLIAFAWIFFRASYLDPTWSFYIVNNLFTGIPTTIEGILSPEFINKHILLNQSTTDFVIAIGLIIFMEIIHYFQRNKSVRTIINAKPAWFRWTIYYVFVMAFIYLGVFDTPAQFIYFQF